MSNLLGLGKQSKTVLSTCHPDLQKVIEHVAAWFPIKVLECHRGKEAQDTAYAAGTSLVKWPSGRHNKLPSEAVDAVPLKWSREKGAHVDWKDLRLFFALAGAMLATARFLGVRLVWGMDWQGQWAIDANKFNDGPHFELKKDAS